MKMFIHVALLASLASPLAWSAGTVQVYTPDSEKPKTLTNAGHLLDLVGQPRLAKSWWTGAVISERQATIVAEQKHQGLLARLSGLAQQEDADDAGGQTQDCKGKQQPAHEGGWRWRQRGQIGHAGYCARPLCWQPS